MKELQSILLQAHNYFIQNKKCVLATIVKIEGSGYRRQGTRMLISEDGEFTGAISGGCVEKEVWLQSKSVFNNGRPMVMTYDGRYRLGCEGTLFILIEPILLNDETIRSFQQTYSEREKLILNSIFLPGAEQDESSGTYLKKGRNLFPLNGNKTPITTNTQVRYEKFEQVIKPVRSLYIFGSEHDSVSLCRIASTVGWDVTIIAHPLNEKQISFFPGAKNLVHLLPEEINKLRFDQETACILMAHSFSRDLAYLLELSKKNLVYIGLLGPHKRKNQLLEHLIEQQPDISEAFLDNLYGPVGMDIGAETPEEIAIAILAELQAVFTETEVDHLKNKSGSIHARE